MGSLLYLSSGRDGSGLRLAATAFGRWATSLPSSLRPGVDDDLHRIGRDGLLHRRRHLVEPVAMGDELPQRIVSHVPRHLAEAGSVGGGLLAAHAEDADALG